MRIYKQQEVVGAGFLVSDEYILTCAHVVATALEVDPYSSQKPTQEVKLDFPTIQPIQRLTATVEFWLPVNPGHSPEDIAVLKLTKSPPAEAQPAYLSMAKEQLTEHEFEAFGFPKGRSDGAWAEGLIKKYVGGGWIQLVDSQVTGYRLEAGFSGTPIWDKQIKAVVGMAVAADKLRPEIKAAFMIPTELFFQAWNRISEFCFIDNRLSGLIVLLESYFIDENNQISEINKKLINEIYQKSLPEIAIRDCPNNISPIVRKLDSYKLRRIDEYLSLEKFIGYLYFKLRKKDPNAVIVQKLLTWLENYTSNYRGLINLIEQEQIDSPQPPPSLSESSLIQSPCLLIGVFDENNENDALTVRAWSIKDSNQYDPNEGSGCDRLTDEKNKLTTDRELNNLSKLIKGFHEQCLALCKSNLKKIYISLPYKLIDRHQAIDKIVIEDCNPFFPCIGTKYEVAIRFSERFKSIDIVDQYLFLCLDKWQVAKKKKNNQQPIIEIVENSDLNNLEGLFQKLMPETNVGFSTNQPIAKSDLISIMEVFYYSGIPVALWIRDDLQNLNACQRIEDFCQEYCFDNLSNQIKMRRCQDWKRQAIGNHLSFLLENFDLMPPKNLLSMS